MADLAYFRAIPWCAALIADPELQFFPHPGRARPRRKGANEYEEYFWRKVLLEQIPHTISFCRRPPPPPAAATTTTTAARGPANVDPPVATSGIVSEVCSLVALGPGLTGFKPEWVHGGIIATLFDDGLLAPVGLSTALGLVDVRPITKRLSVEFKKPVPTRSVVQIVATIVQVNGHDYMIRGTMEDEGGGQVLATVEMTIRAYWPKL